MPSPKPIKLVSKVEDKELRLIGEELFRRGFPNPERLGCPGRETLRTLAFRSQKLPLSERQRYFDHMTCCSPCFSEFSAFVDQARYRGRMVVLGICALLLITVGMATWFGFSHWRPEFLKSPEPITHKTPPTKLPSDEKKPQEEPGLRKQEQETVIAGREPAPKTYRDVVLDLRDQAVTRGQKPTLPKVKYPMIPRGFLSLSIYLPFGSEAGKYHIRIYKDPNKPLLETTGMATIRKSITVLEFKLDTNQFSPGQYVLETLPSGWTSGYSYTFLIEE